MRWNSEVSSRFAYCFNMLFPNFLLVHVFPYSVFHRRNYWVTDHVLSLLNDSEPIFHMIPSFLSLPFEFFFNVSVNKFFFFVRHVSSLSIQDYMFSFNDDICICRLSLSIQFVCFFRNWFFALLGIRSCSAGLFGGFWLFTAITLFHLHMLVS